MYTRSKIARLLFEAAVVVAVAAVVVTLVMPAVAPGVGGCVGAAFNATMVALIAGPLIWWRARRRAAAIAGPKPAGAVVRSARSLRVFVVAIVVLGVTLSALAGRSIHRAVMSAAHTSFERIVDRECAEIETRINQIACGLKGARGTYAASKSVERHEMGDYVRSRDLPREFPGALGMGVIKRVNRADLDRFIESERADGAPSFSVHGIATKGSPLEHADDLWIITCCFPEGPNATAWGLDIGAEAARREAVTRAVASGNPTITDRIQLVQEKRNVSGFLYMVPVYRNGTSPTDAEERLRDLDAVLYAPIVLEDALQGIDPISTTRVDLHLFRGPETAAENLLIDSRGDVVGATGHVAEGDGRPRLLTRRTPLRIADQVWTAVFETTPVFEAEVDTWLAPVAGLAGSILTFLAGSAIWHIGNGRRTAELLVEHRTNELSSALREVTAFRTALDCYSIVSVADRAGKIIDVNAMFSAISGYSREELIGQDHRLLNSGHHPKSFWVEAWRTLANGQAWRGEVCNRRKDASLYWVDSVIVPIAGADGSIDRYVSIRTDITAQKQAKSRIEAQRRLLTQMESAAEVGGWEFDIETNALRWTPQTHKIHEAPTDFKPTIETAIGFYAPEAQPVISDAVNRAMTFGETFDLELPLVTASGREIWVRAVGCADFANGKAKRIYGAFQDITAARSARQELLTAKEDADAASRAKSEFLANMSHEIRTPLTAILGFADLLREVDAALAPQARTQTIDTIRSAGTHLLTVINDILDLSKIEAGRMTVEKIETGTAQVLLEVESLCRPRASQKGVALTARLASPVPDRVMADPTRLRQILMNLVGNAVKFTDKGAVTIEASATRSDRGDRLVIDVIDTGEGLDAGQAQRLFQAFTQADASVTRRHGGTGLGLTICRRLANLMEGNVSLLRTAPGEGSTFRIDLPLVPASGSVTIDTLQCTTPDAAATVGQRAVTLRGRILLAEDGQDNQRLIAHYLRRAGAELEIAPNGRAALEMFERADADGRPFDILLTDMQMPELDGYALASTLRSRGVRTPIVALTAHAMAEDRKKCTDAGCDDYATKPIDKTALLLVCERWIAASQADPGRTVRSKAAA